MEVLWWQSKAKENYIALSRVQTTNAVIPREQDV